MIAMPDPSTNNPSAALVAHMMWSGSLFALCRSAKKKKREILCRSFPCVCSSNKIILDWLAFLKKKPFVSSSFFY